MARTGRPRLKVKRTSPIKTHVYQTEATAFTEACKQAKLEPPDVLRELVTAWVKHVKETPRATLHFRLIQTE